MVAEEHETRLQAGFPVGTTFPERGKFRKKKKKGTVEEFLVLGATDIDW